MVHVKPHSPLRANPIPTQRPISLAAVDLDGTLLNERHEIPDHNLRAVHKMIDQGIKVCLASGRMHESVDKYNRELGLSTPSISYNGAMVRHAQSADVLRHCPVPAELAAEVVEFCATGGYHLNYYAHDRVYMIQRGRWAEHYLAQTGSPLQITEDLRSLHDSPPTKLILITEIEEAITLLQHFRQRFDGSLYVTRTNPEYVEFMHPEANKGSALEFIAKSYGYEREQVAAFGDADNDAPMLSWAADSFAMPNGSALAKQAARHLAPATGFAAAVEVLLSDKVTV